MVSITSGKNTKDFRQRGNNIFTGWEDSCGVKKRSLQLDIGVYNRNGALFRRGI